MSSGSRWDYFPPPSVPRAVEGGLKARSKRGAIGQTWWSQRFIEVLESIGLGNRLARGRNYARRGQVISLDVDAGVVAAQVQGSRARPYRVRIGLAAFGKSEWTKLEHALASSAWYLAKLLAGEMPDDIEEVFTGVGLSLFPTRVADLTMDCTCPDWEVPCKHLAAVFYLLAETFDDDPFTILAWRGRERADLLANLNAARGDGPAAADAAEQVGKPLEECLDTFFALQGELPAPAPWVTGPDALLGQLPEIAVAVRGRPLADLLRPAYLVLGSADE
jgi:uncharacterized Zn finger protein